MNSISSAYKYMVCTSCMTFNQSSYITDAMNGFSMQETTFPVVYLITDDASTDGEPDVIRQYLSEHFHKPYREDETDNYHLICANHLTNPNCIFVVFLLKYNHYSIRKTKHLYHIEWKGSAKYIAFCEGDDYWTNPLKLQKQVDLMEKNPDSTVCGTGFVIHDEEGWEKDMTIDAKPFFRVTLNEWQKDWYLKTLTMLVRSEVYTKAYSQNFKYQYFRDTHLQYHILKEGPGLYISENMGVYRRNNSSTWGGANKITKLTTTLKVYEELFFLNEKDSIVRPKYIQACWDYIKCKEIESDKKKYTRDFLKYNRDFLLAIKYCYLQVTNLLMQIVSNNNRK